MSISVIIPNYNHARYIAVALVAVLRQTRPADEVIVIDDASSDDSIAVIERAIAGAGRVRLMRQQQNAGVLAAMNLGIKISTGRHIAFLAADDEVLPAFLERSTGALVAAPGAAFSSASVHIVDPHGRRLGTRPVMRPRSTPGFVSPAQSRALLAVGDNFYLGPATLYRREQLLELGGFDPSLGSAADGMLQRRMAIRWGSVFLSEVLARWRIHGDNYSQVSATEPATLDQLVARCRAVIEAEPAGLFPPAYADLFERRLRFGAARLLALRLATEPGLVDRMAACAGAGPMATRALRTLARTGRLAPHLAMAALTMAMRPFALSRLAADVLLRPIQETR